jgi:hypothetical protein
MGWLEDVMGRLQGMQGRGWAGNNPMAQQLNRGPQMGDQGGFGRMMQERGGWGQGGQQFQMPQFNMDRFRQMMGQQGQSPQPQAMLPPQAQPPQGMPSQGFQGQPQPQPQPTPQPMATHASTNAGMDMNEMTGQRIPSPSSSLSTGLKMGAPARPYSLSGGFGI